MCADFPHHAVERRGARNPAGMNQDTITALEIRGVLLEFKGKCIGVGNNFRSTDRPEIFHAKLESAVVEKVGEVLVGVPALTLNKASESSEILQVRTFCGTRAISKDVRRLLAPCSCP